MKDDFEGVKGDWLTKQQEECKQNLRCLLDFNNAELFMAKREDDFVGFIALNRGFSTTKGLPFLRIQLNTGTQNTNARNLYKALGFEWQPDKEIYMYFLH